MLVATTAFAALPGAPVPDFVMPPLMKPINGKVCFVGNPANPFSFDVNLCLSYGNVPLNLTDGAGPAAPALRLSGEPIRPCLRSYRGDSMWPCARNARVNWPK